MSSRELNEAEGIQALGSLVMGWKREWQERFAEGRAEIANDRYLPDWEKERRTDELRASLDLDYQRRSAELVAASHRAVDATERRVREAHAKAVEASGKVGDPARVQALAADYTAQLGACRSQDERVALAVSFIDQAGKDADHLRAVRTATMPTLNKAQREAGSVGFSARRAMSHLRSTLDTSASPEQDGLAVTHEAAQRAQEMLIGHIGDLRQTVSGNKAPSDWSKVFDADPSLLDVEPAAKPRRPTIGDAMWARIARGETP